MPSFRHGKLTAVLFGQENLSPYLNEATVSSPAETAETTTFGNSAKTYVSALRDATISLGGMFEGLVNDPTLHNAMHNASSTLVTVCPAGLTSGQPCFLGVSRSNSYEISSPVSDVVSVTSELQMDGGIYAGKVVAGGITVGAGTSAGSATVDNSAYSSNGYVANLHITANTANGATTVKLQHSADNSTWVDLVTFTVASGGAQTSEQKSATGTVNRYIRASVSVGGSTGSITYSMAVSRR